jgi:hypothetical protein
MPLLHQQIHSGNRWFPLTHTMESVQGWIEKHLRL